MLAQIRTGHGIFKSFKSLVIKMAYAGEAATSYRLGKDYKKMCDMASAMKCFKKAIKIEPHYADAHYELGEVYHELGKLFESVDAFKIAATLYPKLINAHLSIGISYFNRRKFDESIPEFEKAIRAHSNLVDAHNKMATEYMIAGIPAEWESHNETALKLYKDVAMMHLHLSAVYEKQGKFEKAIHSFKKAMKVNPDNDSAQIHDVLGELYKKAGKKIEADEQFEIAKALKTK